MKRLIFSLLFGMLFFSCDNTEPELISQEPVIKYLQTVTTNNSKGRILARLTVEYNSNKKPSNILSNRFSTGYEDEIRFYNETSNMTYDEEGKIISYIQKQIYIDQSHKNTIREVKVSYDENSITEYVTNDYGNHKIDIFLNTYGQPVEKVTYYDLEKPITKETYTWKDGNITSIKNYEYSGEEEYLVREVSITYDTYHNPYTYLKDLNEIRYTTENLKTTNNPLTILETYYNDDYGYTSSASLQYEYDKEEYPISYFYSYSRNATHSSDHFIIEHEKIFEYQTEE
ncbi:hypothetical protein [Flammeovirga agarivorans]|uniref:Uncharacterized protein n=1 Tax=Flammeovirga agarivorans TaxID=2726742 RepID=A0A7X8SJB2_9BACT|nr:hypothetical protein [Flammeovirga agarivorans]NLR91178.1 hypothetical protein [Flammeovirga agarivorans]